MLPHKKINIMVVDDELSIREAFADWLKQDGYEVDTAADGMAALDKIKERHSDIMLVDVKMPRMDGITMLKQLKEIDPDTAVVMMTAHGAIQDAVEAMKLGANDYLLKPFELDELSLTIEKLVQMQTLAMENLILKDRVASITHFENLLGQSPPMLQLFESIVNVAQSDATVLITGETGTGKELVARTIHAQSPRVIVLLLPSTVAPSRNISWRVSSSAMRKELSPTPNSPRKAGWKWPTPGPSFSMKWETSRRRCRSISCESWKPTNSTGLEGPRR